MVGASTYIRNSRSLEYPSITICQDNWLWKNEVFEYSPNNNFTPTRDIPKPQLGGGKGLLSGLTYTTRITEEGTLKWKRVNLKFNFDPENNRQVTRCEEKRWRGCVYPQSQQPAGKSTDRSFPIQLHALSYSGTRTK